MICAFSTSSPRASVAFFDDSGAVLWSGARDAPQAASAACMKLLEEAPYQVDSCSVFLADLGPGSFTGVRVGVTLAKTFAFAIGGRAGGATAFDLISLSSSVVVPSRRGEFFVREPGRMPVRTADLPANPIGYGFGGPDSYPDAAAFAPIVPGLAFEDPLRLVPQYLVEPSISVPKKPFARPDAR